MSKQMITAFIAIGILGSMSFVAYANEEDSEADSSVEEVQDTAGDSLLVEDTVNEDEEGLLEQPYDLSEVESPNPSLATFTLAAENEQLALYVEEDSLAIKVVNKKTDYVWSSTIDDIEAENLNETWQTLVRSAVSIDSINQRNQESTEYLLEDETLIDLDYLDDGFSATIQFPSEIKLALEVKIDGSHFTVNIPEESIEETEDARLTNLSLYPFLGATKQNEVSGYQFIPDGSGALVRFDDDSARMDYPYRSRIYGEDQGITTGQSLTDTQAPHVLSMPVYGFVHGVDQNALFSIIEAGAEYSELVAYKAGLSTEFNWLTTEFIFRSAYRQPTNRSGTQAIDSIQANRNVFDIQLRFELLEEEAANYVGMAKAYQAYLLDSGMLSDRDTTNPAIRLEFLGGEREEGLFWDRYIAMTSITDVLEHVETLSAEGMDEAMLVYKGWYDGGFTGKLPNKFPLDSRLGSKNEAVEVQDELSQLGFDLHFQTDYTRAYSRPTQIDNNEYVEQINTSDLTFRESENTSYSYLLPTGAKELVERDLAEYEDYGMTNLALKNTPKALFSTHNNGNASDRGENKEATIALVEQLNEQTGKQSALYEPNAYLWDLAGSYLDIPMDNSRYIYMTDAVPFIQIVLKGHLDYYAPFSNFVPNQRENTLKTIEYGAFPSFYLTTEDPFSLIDTDSSHLYTSQFENWQEAVLTQYTEVKQVVDATRDATIESREIVEEGLIKVSYSNDVHVLVNYTEEAVVTDFGTVDGQSFIISEGGE
ncbi:DUF5696 domain-containing protein [Alkalibacterium sp. f15]|uniref:DUF5696 domain-containing protein n=1 Tax=Alkalibacterium sp. f15 TaxID=3414029 RepID=UPI003BF7F861